MSSRKPAVDRSDACSEPGCCDKLDRRQFVKLSGASLVAMGMGESLAAAGPFGPEDTADHLIPIDKKLRPEWIRMLFARGERQSFSGDDLKTIGMPVGGIAAGQVYLTGDGRLVYWGIFNQNINSGFGAVNYKVGRLPTEMVVRSQQFTESPRVDQGVAVRVRSGGKTFVRALDKNGFPDVTFCGEYPIAQVDYQASDFPVRIKLESFSPFIPLNESDSALPATILNYTLKNTTDDSVEVTLAGWLQNSVLHYSGDLVAATVTHHNRVVNGKGFRSVLLESKKADRKEAAPREPIVLADFEKEDYGDWTVSGEAFGKGPARGTLAGQQKVSGFKGQGLVNTFLKGDGTEGKLVSPPFLIDRHFISFLIGGGGSRRTALRLIVDGKMVREASGRSGERLERNNWTVREFEGKQGRLEIIDQETGAWGHINVDQIELRDTAVSGSVEDVALQPDFGTMALTLLGDGGLVSPSLPSGPMPENLFDGAGLATEDAVEKAIGVPHRAAVGKSVSLEPGEESTITLIVSWNMPNMYFRKKLVKNQYAGRFGNATDVGRYVAQNMERLAGQTRLWHDTYYDSTLPYWLLDRLHSTVANLASTTCQWWGDGRFWAYEGCGCCPGTCGHVWNYEHAMARLFPRLERSVREMQDFASGVGFIPETGEIRFRGENWGVWAGDSQGGYILKAYREHQTSVDDAFLKRNWKNIRKAVQFLIDQDGNADGLIEGRQHQTYDRDYYGANTMVGSLYLGALRAAEEMARDMQDDAFADQCRKIFEAGSENSIQRLFNGEYFIQEVDLKKHPDWQYVDGCLADQLFGQGWAHRVALGYIYPKKAVLKSLTSIWKYCWAPDVGGQNEKHAPQRWFAYPVEAGLFTCTWPKSSHMGTKSTLYRDEIWTGIEYQVANHMAYEGMVTEALAICRGVHDRYHPSKRNPYNEIECGDHYARAMASLGVLLGLAGFEYHGPKRRLGFAPRMNPEHFRSVFSTADSWGTYDQRRAGDRQFHTVDVKWGRLRVGTLYLALPEGRRARKVRVGDQHADVSVTQDGDRVAIEFSKEIEVPAGGQLQVEIAY